MRGNHEERMKEKEIGAFLREHRQSSIFFSSFFIRRWRVIRRSDLRSPEKLLSVEDDLIQIDLCCAVGAIIEYLVLQIVCF